MVHCFKPFKIIDPGNPLGGGSWSLKVVLESPIEGGTFDERYDRYVVSEDQSKILSEALVSSMPLFLSSSPAIVCRFVAVVVHCSSFAYAQPRAARASWPTLLMKQPLSKS